MDPEDEDLSEVVEEIVKKCGGLPQIISTIAGYLQEAVHPNQWRKFCDNMSSELENKPELKDIDRMLTTGYKNLPFKLKSCFLYLSVFPEGKRIRQRRLIRRWIAEGYSSAKHSTSADQVAEKQFDDLISRNMIQPSGTTNDRIGNNRENHNFGFQNLMHGVSRKKSAEENLVLVLDKNEHSTSLQAKSRARHLTVMEDWSRERKKHNALKSIIHLCHIRSMTVFGECKSFFISKKMKLLRVLDLEGTHGIRDSDLSPIGKLRHLRYLSLRRTEEIFHLPASLGNLYNLETLDVRDTMVTKLPPTIVQLQKLKYLRAGITPFNEDDSYATVPEDLRAYSFFEGMDLKMLVPLICLMVTVWLRGFDVHGVEVPEGIEELKALHTLGVVNVARGKNVLKDIKKLTQLRKLGITGIKKNHCEEFGAAISSCSHLQTLSLRAEGKDGLVGCLDLISPPEDLQSLKLHGILYTLPRWIGQLKSLVKLTLRSTLLKQEAIKVIGKLLKLNSLRLSDKSFEDEELLFPRGSFPNLMALEIAVLIKTKSVKFEEPTKAEPTMASLELIKVESWWDEESCLFTGIRHLKSLKEVMVDGLDCGKSEEDLQKSGLKVERMAGQEVTTVGLELTEH